MSRAISVLVGNSGRAEAVGKGLQKLLQGSSVTVEMGSRRAGVPAVAAFLPKDQTVGLIKATGATAAVYASQPSAKLYPNKMFEKADVTAVVNAIRTATDSETRDTCLRAALRIAGEKQVGLQVVTGFGADDWVTPLAEPLKEAEPGFKATSISNVTLAKAVNQTVMFGEASPAVYLAARGDAPAGVPAELSGASGVRNTMSQLVQGISGGIPLATFSYHDQEGPVLFTGSSELAIFVAAARALQSIGADKEAAAVLAAVAKACTKDTVATLAWENNDASGQAVTAKVA